MDLNSISRLLALVYYGFCEGAFEMSYVQYQCLQLHFTAQTFSYKRAIPFIIYSTLHSWLIGMSFLRLLRRHCFPATFHNWMRKPPYQGTVGNHLHTKVRSEITRVRPFNLDCCILPSKVVSDKFFLSHLWTDTAEMLVDFSPKITRNVH